MIDQGLLSSYVSSIFLRVQIKVASQQQSLRRIAVCLLRFVTISVFHSCCCWLRYSSRKEKIPFRNKRSWLIPRYTSEQPRDNVRVLQGGRRGHNHGEQTDPEPDPDSSPGPDSKYGQPPWNCRGSSPRGPR